MTPNDVMNDEARLEIITKLCRSIWRQEIFRDHPDWWVLLYPDEFILHINVINDHEIFAEFKIMLIKVEGDTSHVCQAYAQQVSKYDKRHIRGALNMLNHVLGQSMYQWHLIDIAINDQNCIKE